MHIGQLIKQELARQGRSVIWLAEQLSYSPTYVHEIFDGEAIDAELLLRISKLLNVNFFKLYSDEFEVLVKG